VGGAATPDAARRRAMMAEATRGEGADMDVRHYTRGAWEASQ
jgi:hypothetical protein